MFGNYRISKSRQTPWACGHKGEIWYAMIYGETVDEIVIDNAKRIVERALPEQPNSFWEYHYFFARKEFLLNLILSHNERYGTFPAGSVCIVDKWMWSAVIFKHNGEWCSWQSLKNANRSQFTTPGKWVQIPSLLSILSDTSTKPETTHGNA